MDFREWAKQIPKHKQETLVQVLNDLNYSCTPDNIRAVENELRAVKMRIEVQNKFREAVQAQTDNIVDLLKLINGDAKNADDPTLSLLSAFLTDRLVQLRVQINDAKPSADLKLKHDLSLRLQHLNRVRDVVTSLGETLKCL